MHPVIATESSKWWRPGQPWRACPAVVSPIPLGSHVDNSDASCIVILARVGLTILGGLILPLRTRPPARATVIASRSQVAQVDRQRLPFWAVGDASRHACRRESATTLIVPIPSNRLSFPRGLGSAALPAVLGAGVAIQDTPSLVILAICVCDSGRFVLSTHAGCRFCTLTVRHKSITRWRIDDMSSTA